MIIKIFINFFKKNTTDHKNSGKKNSSPVLSFNNLMKKKKLLKFRACLVCAI